MARLSATRLPGKPLLKINGVSIISNVVKKAKEADIGEVYVATEDKEISEDVKLNGGKAILTSNKHKTGSDRIFECFEKLDLKDLDYIINLQGDEPNINIDDLKHLKKLIELNKPEIGTLASKIEDKSNLNNENIVKVITDRKINDENFPIALDFKRIVKNFDLNKKEVVVGYSWLPDRRPLSVVVTSGASCPDILMNQVIDRLVEFFGYDKEDIEKGLTTLKLLGEDS